MSVLPISNFKSSSSIALTEIEINDNVQLSLHKISIATRILRSQVQENVKNPGI